MAEMKIEGIDSLGLSLAEIAEIPDDVAGRMVTAGAEIAKTAQKAFGITYLYPWQSLRKQYE